MTKSTDVTSNLKSVRAGVFAFVSRKGIHTFMPDENIKVLCMFDVPTAPWSSISLVRASGGDRPKHVELPDGCCTRSHLTGIRTISAQIQPIPRHEKKKREQDPDVLEALRVVFPLRSVHTTPSTYSWNHVGGDFYTLSITGYIIQHNTFAEYSIEVKSGQDTWVVNRRFREFVDLWNQLYSLGPRLPPLPPKTFLCFRDLSPNYLAERRHALENCLWDLLQLTSAGEIDSIKDFLELIRD
ncbi:hypothetical protein LEN26_019468 [Aphanomyces euteiches]|nr:hypothetical protein LEN26_019468 [Aphanomyces euteiches]KAH9122590.1 hypothetical protein AeMF1_006177 [Aphanomyces euteiches]KAH9184163.1 hypothetical protein AeNC1_013862 [Aphanomyces euteiches]